MEAEIDMFPVVETGPLQVLVIDLETERFDEMKRSQSRRTQAGNASGVRRDLRFEQYDVHIP
jgi:hypothetical protein